MALPQPLHIFRKDILHLWPETLVTLVLFVACAWSAPSGWSHSQYVAVATILAAFLKYFLMPVSWLVLISRLIHDESLVGDRQFWTSRPYNWASLLTAKLLFLAVFLYLPFLLMQVYLLKHAGLYPTTVIPALLKNLLLLTVIVIVPLTAISAVTATFARMLLSTVGAIIYILVVAVSVGILIFRRMPPPNIEYIFVALIILLPLAAVIYQYATRHTLVSRIMLAAVPLLIVLLLLITPATALIQHAYPVASGSDAPKLGALPEGLLPKTAPAGKLATQSGNVQVGIPVTVSGIDKNTSYTVSGIAATVDAPGVHWASPYLNTLGLQITGASPLMRIPITMPADVFHRIGDNPSSIHLSVAATHLRAEDASSWKATLLPFAVPGHGLCSFSSDDPDEPPTCRYPFKTPDLNFVSAPLSASCADPNAPKAIGSQRMGSGLTLLDFDPVVTVRLDLPTAGQPEAREHVRLCPGTPLSFIEAKDQGRTRLEIDEKGIYLAPLAARLADHEAPQPQPTPQ